MKKIFLIIVATLFVSLFSITITKAESFVPNNIDLITTIKATPTYKSGDLIDLKITLSKSRFPLDKITIEYGVVKQITNKNTTIYEPISTYKTEEAYSRSETQLKKLEVPNILESNSTSTYVFYVKTSVKDEPDQENFIVSKQNFKITGNATKPLTKVKYASILQSNGARFPLSSPTTIYDLTTTKYKGVASSTSIEITFESNTESTLTPNITSSKLKSDIPIPDFTPKDIIIKKGRTDIIIPLPNFNYEPGIYQGVLKLNNVNIPDVNFQYTVGGGAVAFDKPEYNKTSNNQILNFNIHGAPVDFNLDPVLNNFSTSTLEKMFSKSNVTYNTLFILKDAKDTELFRSTEGVDFSSSTHSLLIPTNVRNIAKVYIKTTDTEGKILYEGTKEVSLPETPKDYTYTYLIFFLISIILILIFKNKYIRLILVIIALILLLSGVKIIKADVWKVPYSAPYLIQSYQTIRGNVVDNNLTRDYFPEFDFDDSFIKFSNYIEYEPYSMNEDLQLTYRASGGFHRTKDGYITQEEMTDIVYLYDGDTNIKLAESANTSNIYNQPNWYYARYNYYIINTNWITVNLGKPVKNSHVYVGQITYFGFQHKNPEQGVRNILFWIPLRGVIDTASIPSVTATSSNVTDTTANIDWTYKDTQNKSQTDYEVSISLQRDFSTIVQTKVNTDNSTVNNVRSTAMTGLNPKTKYYARIKSSNGVSWSEYAYTDFTTSSSTCVGPDCDNGDGDGGGNPGGGGDDGTSCIPDPTTGKCPPPGDVARDYCPNINIPGVQKEDDPLYAIASCNVPTLGLLVRLDKPYASETTFKCSVRWEVTSSNIPLEYARCTLDGVDIKISGNKQISIGRHSITCSTEVKGEDGFVLSSVPLTKQFRCSQVPRVIEN